MNTGKSEEQENGNSQKDINRDNLFSEDIITEYSQWKKANSGHFTWWNYVGFNASIQLALGFAKFYYPEVIIKDKCFILKDKFDEKTFEKWKEDCGGDKTEIEKMMNLYNVDDFFEEKTDFDDPNISKQIQSLAVVLKTFWNMSFKERFPDKSIIIDVFDYFDATSITVYEKTKNF